MNGREVRKTCPTCAFSWLDRYGKNECPKCLQPLTGLKPYRAPGEVSTYKYPAGDAMESASGQCSRGGPHTWRFGRCSKCSLAEGYGKDIARPANYPGGRRSPCLDGLKHAFKYSRCTKCGASEF
eukprot:EG_transcript_26046